MRPITVVDARMGRGKSSAAIRYMNRYKGTKRFLYITPYLKEVDRICERCEFDQADSEFISKSIELKAHMRHGRNVAATHSLFYLMDDEALDLARSQGYSLIIDESIEVIAKQYVTNKDFELIMTQLVDEDENGRLTWKDREYNGKFDGYKSSADVGSLYRLDTALLDVLNPDMLRAFDEVFMLTYLFDGQYQKAYLDFFGFDYNIVGVERDADGYYFSDKPDAPPPIDYSSLINIIDNPRMNAPGKGKTDLSKNWYTRRRYDSPEIRALRNGMRNFFEQQTDGSSQTRLWTCFKEDQAKLIDKNSGRFRSSFLQVASRATNEYRDRTDIAYMVNRFADPNVMKFFATNGISINEEHFALSEMLQWIWRSAIRDDQPINLYIPSSRMRGLLIEWIGKMSEGGK
jgi:hypothetical protein